MPSSRVPSRASPAPGASFEAFAVSAPGLEPLIAEELRALGISANVEEGGLAFRGSLETMARANLWLRTASRVVVRVAGFHARSFAELERHARGVSWERFLAPGAPARIRITSRKSRLYHTGAIAQRVAEAIVRRLGTPATIREAGEGDREGVAPPQLFVVRVLRDHCAISADSSGALLHRRGYRQAVARAPLRETLAAAMLLGSGWRGRIPLLDPMCGSGTIPIEAALIARGIPPGLRRSFALEQWPEWEPHILERLRHEALESILPASPVPILGSDRDAGAVDAARANAERAAVAADVDFARRALSAAVFPEGRVGALVTNPPYGVRIGDVERLRDLYAQLGHLVRDRCPGWMIALLATDERLEAQLQMPLTERFRTVNGGIPVKLLVGDVPGR